MGIIDDKELDEQKNNEENTKRRFITPIIQERWKDEEKIIMEYPFTDGRISIDEYNIAHRGKKKRVDYLLLWKNNVLLAVVEAKGRLHSADEGYAQAVNYARLLDVPFAYTTNGDVLIERDMISGLNKTMSISDFPYPDDLWNRYVREKGLKQETIDIFTYPYYITPTGKKPRYYQRIAINRTIEAVAEGQKRLLLVMATGTGKTFCSFQIIYRFWKTRTKKKILYLADRNILIDQTMRKDFKPFAEAMVKIDNKSINTSKEIFLGLYQQLKTGENDYYKQLPRDFFDLIIIDECHRGSANEDSNWHDILEYFKSAVQIGMTATPKDGGLDDAINDEANAREKYNKILETQDSLRIAKAKKELDKAIEKRYKAETKSNQKYFGNPIYVYSLKQGIEDGFLAPYKVVSVGLNVDKYGYRPNPGDVDINGEPLDSDIVYTQEDFDRKIVLIDRRKQVAKRITEFLKANDMRYSKTIIFCESIEHASEMVRFLENENADLVAENSRYIVQITGDNAIGKEELDNFVEPTEKYPVIAVTSRLLSTGVDCETCELVVLDRSIGSMTEFKQIVGRGTRVKEAYEVDGEEKTKMYFTILDFRKNYLKFNDPEFDGEPVTVVDVPEGNPFPKPPIKPTPSDKPPLPPKAKHKIARVNGVDVEILGEDVQYMDLHGNLVTQNLSNCVKNNIIGQYKTFDDFKAAWLLTRDKQHMANDLLLEVDWSQRFKIQYGYDVDDFDIISYLGYDIDPPMSKNQRTHNRALALYLDTFDEKTRQILRLLLDSYPNNSFENLKDIKNIFSQPEFASLGYTPMKVIKSCFKTKERYFEILNELQNKLYE